MLDMIYLVWIFNFLLIGLILLHKVNGQCNGTGPQILNADSSPQYFTSPNYPSNYPSNANCSWRIVAPSPDDKIIINIEDYDSESTTSDYMDLYDGYNSSAVLIIRMAVTNRKSLNEFVSSSDVLFFTFVSDHAVQYSGFQILYFSNNTGNQQACGSTLNVTTQEQVLMSSNLPQPYNATECSWNFTSSTGILFQIKFLDLGGCLQSYLRIYDGTSTNDDRLSSECSTALTYEFDDITTSGFNAHIAFKVTDQPQDYYGFMLVYRTNIVTTTSTTTTAAPTTTIPPGIFDNCTASGAYMNASISPNFDYIYSPDYGSGAYPSNKYCRWYITAPDNYAVEAYFDNETYAIESNSYCRYDYVIFYDGNLTSDTMLNKFCGLIRPTTIYRSTSTQMLIVFSSDYTIQKAGFRIRIRAVENTYPGCKADYISLNVLYNRLDDYIFNNYTFINNITSPGFDTSDYPLNLEVFWLFFNSNTTAYRIVLDIISISIERSNDCIYDRLVLYNGPCLKDGVLDTVCGYWKKHWDLEGEEYLLHFHSDGYISQSGFLINYYAEEKTAPTVAITSTTTFGPPVGAVVEAVKEMLTNYSNENLPARDLSEPVRAFVDFYFVGINGLDEVSQKLTSVGQFIVTWNDSSLTWDPTKRQGVVQVLLPQNDIWKPDIALFNGFTKITAMGAKFMFIDINYNGSCIWKPYQVMDSVCQVDMTHYPYDRQICILKFGTWSSDDSQVVTELGRLGLQIHPNFQENAEWRLITTKTKQVLNGLHKSVEFHITLERNSRYVTYYMTIPIIMLAYMNVFVFAVPCESGEKTGYSITIFLSLVVLLIVNNQSLPNNSDTTSLYAVYVLAMTVLSAIALIISTIEVRAIAFNEKMFPISKRVKKFIAFVNKVESLIVCEDTDHNADQDGDKSGDVQLRPYKTDSLSSSCRSSSASSLSADVHENDGFSYFEDNNYKRSNQCADTRNRDRNIVTLERQTTLFEEGTLMRRSETPSFEIHSPQNDIHKTMEELSAYKNDTCFDVDNISTMSVEKQLENELSNQLSIEEQTQDNASDIDRKSFTSVEQQSSNPQFECENGQQDEIRVFDPHLDTSFNFLTPEPISKQEIDNKSVDSLFDSESLTSMRQNLSKESSSSDKDDDLKSDKMVVDSNFDKKSDTYIVKNSNNAHNLERILQESSVNKQQSVDSDKNGPPVPPQNADNLVCNGSTKMQIVQEYVVNQIDDLDVSENENHTSRDKIHENENVNSGSTEIKQIMCQSGILLDEITELQPVNATDVKMTRPISATENRALTSNRYVANSGLGSASTRNGRILSASIGRPVLTRDSSRILSVLSKRPVSFKSYTGGSSRVPQNDTDFLRDTFEGGDIAQEINVNDVNETQYSNQISSEECSSGSQREDFDEQDKSEDDLSWPDLVSCIDIIFFVIYLLVTTIMSLALFITMVQAY